jgi:hypothetical protein
MARDWLDPDTRIPFLGIIAMVIIVAVVAIFMKSQLAPFFPEATITVNEDTENLAGQASSSFYGTYEIPLSQKNYLQGVLSTPRRSMSFSIDVQNQLLIITQGDRQEEIELHDEDGKLVATFDYDEISTRVSIEPQEHLLHLSEPGKSISSIDVNLADNLLYSGELFLRNQEHYFQFSPGETYLFITSSNTVRIPLTAKGSLFSGIWEIGGKTYPITVDAEAKTITIEDLF